MTFTPRRLWPATGRVRYVVTYTVTSAVTYAVTSAVKYVVTYTVTSAVTYIVTYIVTYMVTWSHGQFTAEPLKFIRTVGAPPLKKYYIIYTTYWDSQT